MHDIRDLSDRIDRLVLRHEELKRTNVLLTQEVAVLTAERDSLRSRLTAARSRIDALLERLPQEASVDGKAE
jgi:cell division protein ZapB